MMNSDSIDAIAPLRTPAACLRNGFFHRDDRGSFCKPFARAEWPRWAVSQPIEEIFVTTSDRDVVRGMHLQMPPFDHEKFVACLFGRILDVFVDLRLGSPAFGQYETVELDGRRPKTLFIPRGVAHGFCVLEGPATVLYAVSSRHAPRHDAGIRWDSFGMDWPAETAVVSERDRALPPLSEFSSPFRFEEPRE